MNLLFISHKLPMELNEEVDKRTFVPELLHEAICLNQLHCPSLSSALANHNFLMEVREKKVFLLDMKDIRPLHCREAPNNQELQSRLINLIREAQERKLPLVTSQRKWVDGTNLKNVKGMVDSLLEHLESRLADKAWLLQWLSTLHRNGLESDFFRRDYVPENIAQPKTKVKPTGHNNDSFFRTGTPIKKRLMKKRLFRPMTAAEKMQRRLEIAKEAVKVHQMRQAKAEFDLKFAKDTSGKKRTLQ